MTNIKKYMVRYPWFRSLPVNIKLTCIIYREGEEWVGRCLDFNLVTTSTRKMDVVKDLKDIISAHIQFTDENDNWDYLFQSAAKEEWDRLVKMKKQCQHEKTKLAAASLHSTVDLCFA
jgi:hypothetical protein